MTSLTRFLTMILAIAFLPACSNPDVVQPLVKRFSVFDPVQATMEIGVAEKDQDAYDALVAVLEEQDDELVLELRAIDHMHDDLLGKRYGWARLLATTEVSGPETQLITKLTTWSEKRGVRGFDAKGEEFSIDGEDVPTCLVGYANLMLLEVSRTKMLVRATEAELRVRQNGRSEVLCYGGTVRLEGKLGRIRASIEGAISPAGVLDDDEEIVTVPPESTYGYMSGATVTLTLKPDRQPGDLATSTAAGLS